MINGKKLIAVCAAVIMGWGLLSCTLEPTADSPANRAIDPPVEGMPEGLTIYEPSITYDGTTTTLTYTVNVSGWPQPPDGLSYTTQEAANADNAKPRSIEALILRYGAGANGLFSNGPVTAVTAKEQYKLKTIAGTESLPHYVIIPLDTSRIREELSKKLPAGAKKDTGEDAEEEDLEKNASDVPLVWIEENPAISEVEMVKTGKAAVWTDGVYEDTGIRIGGFYKKATVSTASDGNDTTTFSYKISTVENFDDGEDDDDDGEGTRRILSIATVLADGMDRDKQRYTSTINFYIDSNARKIEADVPQAEKKDVSAIPLNNAAQLKQWMKTNKPVLRVVYQWAD